MSPISPEERAMRLGNVAGILIELARREQAAGVSEDDNRRQSLDEERCNSIEGSEQ